MSITISSLLCAEENIAPVPLPHSEKQSGVQHACDAPPPRGSNDYSRDPYSDGGESRNSLSFPDDEWADSRPSNSSTQYDFNSSIAAKKPTSAPQLFASSGVFGSASIPASDSMEHSSPPSSDGVFLRSSPGQESAHRPYFCLLYFAGCQSVVNTKSRWMQHMQNHLKFVVFRCQNCPTNQFWNETSFKDHLRRQDKPPLADYGTLIDQARNLGRDPPDRLDCCTESFVKPLAWEHYAEHVWTEHIRSTKRNDQVAILKPSESLIHYLWTSAIICKGRDSTYQLRELHQHSPDDSTLAPMRAFDPKKPSDDPELSVPHAMCLLYLNRTTALGTSTSPTENLLRTIRTGAHRPQLCCPGSSSLLGPPDTGNRTSRRARSIALLPFPARSLRFGGNTRPLNAGDVI
ncbi:uncharacterized protein LMH87_007576 [Akanthomyces muscarius]|uniref:Uncharacterized protein n=1 Tax=Akanthomyces muscarius TaxID=2231603 RepID=A0A9W8QLX1_AKAMU|nr:uncharacterized protein LMH87_007576 [Akanthomyces muscarius]KAJ4161542.1 hypothetical protein LMH87_007576 [Akanthomyces muscarius]